MKVFFEDREAAARAAAHAVADTLRSLIASNGRAVLLLDCTSKPVEFLMSLTSEKEIDWTQVIVFQASEFPGEPAQSSSSCQHFLTLHLISRVPVVTFHPMRGDAPNLRAALTNLSERLSRVPSDIAFLSTSLFAALTALDSSTEKIARMEVNERVTLSFTLAALEGCRLFVLGETSSIENDQAAEVNEDAVLFTYR